MKVNRSQALTIRKAIEHWNRTGAIDATTADKLSADVEISPFDWKRLAKYSFWIAIVCIVTSLGAVLADQALMEMLSKIFNAPYIVKFLGLSCLSALIYWGGFRRRKRYPAKLFSNEATLFIAVLTTAGAVYELGKAMDNGSGHFSILLLLSFGIYAVIGYCFESNLVWLFALLSFGSWMGTETGYMSGWGAYWLGMNYPLRFVAFGGLLTGSAFLLEKNPRFTPFFASTLATGLLYLFIALWIMSIFGNYGDMESWKAVKQWELLQWSVLFAAVSLAAIYHGLRFDNGMTKGFGLTFLFINLYTRFFEYFWDNLHKALFFAILALSFWLLGSKAEKIWHLGERKETTTGNS